MENYQGFLFTLFDKSSVRLNVLIIMRDVKFQMCFCSLAKCFTTFLQSEKVEN